MSAQTPRGAPVGRARTIPPQLPRLVPPEVTASPRVAALAGAVAAGDDGAVADFWRAAQAEGTPLIEVSEGDPSYRVVTFLWRGDDDVRDVLIIANKFTDATVLAASLMERLPGTDLWHRSYRVRADWRASYLLAPLPAQTPQVTPPPSRASVWGLAQAAAPPDSRAARERWSAFVPYATPDPLNPKTFALNPKKVPPGQSPHLSVVELPDAPPQPWWERREGVPAGELIEQRVRSEALGNERRVWVYTPPGYTPHGGPYPLLVLLDGDTWIEAMPVGPTLDNLIAAGQIPPLVAVLPDVIDVETRVRELACDDNFLAFLTQELLPWVAEDWATTPDPARTIIAGQSLGGLTAAFAGLREPWRFGNILSQSGSFWWMSGSEFDHDAEWLTQQYVRSPRLPLRFYLEVGLQEWVLLPPTRHFHNVLDAKGYAPIYREFNGGHDALCWRGGLADGLIALCAGWA